MLEEGGFGGGGMIEGGSQRWAVTQGKILVLAIPFAATAETLSALSGLIKGRHKILVDITNAKYSSVSETLCPVDIHQVCAVDPSTVPVCSPSLQSKHTALTGTLTPKHHKNKDAPCALCI